MVATAQRAPEQKRVSISSKRQFVEVILAGTRENFYDELKWYWV